MNILALGAHPDDIEFGCGGTLIQYAQAGYDVSLLVVTDGKYGGDPEVRRREQEASLNLLGGKKLYFGGFEDTELQDSRQLILKIDEIIDLVKPQIVFLNYMDDVHQDHRALALAGISASRYIPEVIFYEVPTTQHFEPDIFVDIQNVLEKKLELLRAHASQLDKTRVENLTIVESVVSCAYFRGYQGRVKYAEGFKALRVLRRI